MLNPGSQLGPYEILEALGAGGMGEVYRARDPRLGREVAIKVLPRTVAANPDSLARFEREARAVAALNHPNIVVLHSIEEEGGVRFLTMELVTGRSLDHFVSPGGLPVDQVLDLAIPLADALAAAHGRGVVHRDLKPANVMVTPEGRIKVLDFGLAKLSAAEPEAEATRVATVAGPISHVGQVVGTLPYMSPEQIRGESVDARSDLFSLGVVLYELLTGRRPFAGATSADVSSAILRDPPPPLSGVRADLGGDLQRIVDRCLVKDPERRVQTAKDVRNELELVRREPGNRAASTPGRGLAPATDHEPAGGLPARPQMDPARGLPPRPGAPLPPVPPPASLSPVPPLASAGLPASTGAAASAGFSGAPAASLPGSSPSSPPSAARETPSIAVLPFVNRSRDEDDEYFSDGLADELINLLAKIRGLRVAARASSFQFRGKNEDLAAIGEKLKVATLLDGSVRKSGNRVRISVQLLQAADGFHLWSETYDRTLEDIFAVQDDIAQAVVRELRSTLLGAEPDSKTSGEVRAEVAEAARGRGTDAESHRLFLQGRFHLEHLSREEVVRGIEYLRQALALDPRNALAWATLSRGYWHEGAYGWDTVDEAYARARPAVDRALELEPDLAEAHLALGHLQVSYLWDWKGADASFRRAFELAPGTAAVLRASAGLARDLGRVQEGLALARRAVEQDPLNAAGYGTLCMCYRSAGMFPEGAEAARHALELSPGRVGLRLILSISLLDTGRIEDALAVAQTEDEEWARLTALGAVYHAAGRWEDSERALRTLIEKYSGEAAYQIAAVRSLRGEIDDAFSWLETARRQKDAGLSSVRCEPVFTALRSDPRWIPFLRGIGLAE